MPVGQAAVTRDFAHHFSRTRYAVRTELVSRCDGILYGRTEDRLARPGKVVCKIAGKRNLPDRHPGALLTD